MNRMNESTDSLSLKIFSYKERCAESSKRPLLDGQEIQRCTTTEALRVMETTSWVEEDCSKYCIPA